MPISATAFAHKENQWTPEQELLLCAIRTQIDADSAARIQTIVQNGIDWNELVELAAGHKVVAILWRTLEKVCPAALPETIRSQLKSQMQVNIQGNLFLTKELLHILKLFAQKNITVLPYKGPVLAAAVYNDLTLRPFNDLDILVGEADIVAAMELLKAHGYRLLRPPAIAQLAEELQAEQVRKLVAGSSWAYQLVMAHSQRGMVVELHWRITPRFVFAGQTEELWEDLQAVSVAGSNVASFSPENLLWFLCVHGAKHQWERLSWICDVAQLLHTYPNLDWSQLAGYAQNKGILRRLSLGILLAHELLDAPIPPQLAAQLAAESATDPAVRTLCQNVVTTLFNESETELEQSDLAGLPFQLRSMERVGDRLRYLLYIIGLLITPTSEDRTLLRLPNALSSLYYLLRPIRLVASFGYASVRRRLASNTNEAHQS